MEKTLNLFISICNLLELKSNSDNLTFEEKANLIVLSKKIINDKKAASSEIVNLDEDKRDLLALQFGSKIFEILGKP